MYLLLRGHIRNSFDDDELYQLVKDFIQMDPSLEIYVHTWATENNNMSWRPHKVITNEVIFTYFRDISQRIKLILIDDENNIPLFGSTEGNVTITSPCRKLGWKRYLYGLYRLTNAVYKKNKNATVINMRFDILKNSCAFQTPKCRIINFVHSNIHTKFDRNKFFQDKETYGIDNIFMGTAATQAQLASHLNFCLDDISNFRKDVYHQEYIVFYENLWIAYIPNFERIYFVATIPDLGKNPLHFVFEDLKIKHEPNTLWLEFGVFSGNTINYISNFTSGKVYGFDSFEGLPETWRPGFDKGAFDRNGNLPIVQENVELVKGWFNESLPTFLDSHPGEKVTFLHLDADLYSSTIYVLNELNNRNLIAKDCVVVFDELVNFDGWLDDTSELRALMEFVEKNDVKFEWIGMNGKPYRMHNVIHENVALIIRSIPGKF
jgi:hypothetical protein